MSPDPGLLVGLPPILDAHTETLILGSFPSPASLAARQYYAHRQNQFWRLLGDLLSQPLADLDYAEKQRTLLSHRIGIWDVYCRCTRQGALDSAIRAVIPNDFSRLETSAPCLRRVCFNGKTSGKFERWFREKGYDTCILPSTSPAFTLPLERKVELWREAGLSSPAER
jgi:TDG/mug DNA glycosylase family protein